MNEWERDAYFVKKVRYHAKKIRFHVAELKDIRQIYQGIIHCRKLSLNFAVGRSRPVMR